MYNTINIHTIAFSFIKSADKSISLSRVPGDRSILNYNPVGTPSEEA